MIFSVCFTICQYILLSAYLVGWVPAHPVCRGADGTVGSVDDYVAAGVVFHTETSPGVGLISPGVDVEPATKITNISFLVMQTPGLSRCIICTLNCPVLADEVSEGQNVSLIKFPAHLFPVDITN